MRKKIIAMLKNNNLCANLYYLLRMGLIMILRLFCRQDPHLALFVSYGGKNMSDSPYEVYQAMKQDPRFCDWTLVWGVIHPQNFKGIDTVKMDSINYFKTCLKAKVWVTNSGIMRYLDFKPKKNLFINTWHGIPMKKIGIDEIGVKKSKLFAQKWFEFSKADVNLVCSDYDKKVLGHVFNAQPESLKEWGLPRDDELFNVDYQSIHRIKAQLNIPEDKKIILYAPTVRGNQVTRGGKNYGTDAIDPKKWYQELEDYIILYRAHYYVDTIPEYKQHQNIIDVSQYNDLDALMMISDILISDYSSIVFDYSILERPIYLYTYDLDDYKKYQGLYFNPNEYFNVCMTENDLIEEIKSLNWECQCSKTRQIKQHFYSNQNGDATKKVVDYINRYS